MNTEAQKNDNPNEEEISDAAEAAAAEDMAQDAAQAAMDGVESGELGGVEAPIPSEESLGEEHDSDSRIAMLEAELADAKDKMLRAVAEQENVRRRAQKDIESAQRRLIKNFAGDLLAVADNLRRALDSIDEGARKDNPTIENLLIGVEMTERELMNAFGKHGIRQMQPVGQPFDPNFHEALFEIPDEGQPAGTVAQVVETGYALGDQPLRAAKVGVTKGGPKREAAAPAADAPAEASQPDGTTEPGSHVDESL